MIRTLGIVVLVAGGVLLLAGEARAQLSMAPLNGAATAHLGSTTGGDTSAGTFTLGASVSVVEQNGWGAEFDFGYANEGGSTGDANLQTYMMNLIGIWPTGRFRPFFVAGAGGMRVHGCDAGCSNTLSWTDWGLNGGGGVVYRLNPAVGFRGDVRYFSALQDHPNPARPDDFNFWRISVGVSLLWNIVE